MFFERADDDAPAVAVPVGTQIGLLVAAAGIVVVGVYPQPFIQFVTDSIQMIGSLM